MDEWLDENLGGFEIVAEQDRQIALQLIRHFIAEYERDGEKNGWDKRVDHYLPLIAPRNLIKLAKRYGWPVSSNEHGDWIPWESALQRARHWQDRTMK